MGGGVDDLEARRGQEGGDQIRAAAATVEDDPGGLAGVAAVAGHTVNERFPGGLEIRAGERLQAPAVMDDVVPVYVKQVGHVRRAVS